MNSVVPPAPQSPGDWIGTDSHICRLAGLLRASSFRFRVLRKHRLGQNVYRMYVHAPVVAAAAKPGQFLVLRPGEHSERIPLTIADANRLEGVVAVVFQVAGATTRELAALKVGQYVHDLVGPLGTPSDIRRVGTVACVAGGVGIAVMLPVARALKAAGNRVIGVMGARTKDLLILEDGMREASEALLAVTDDGSYGEKGLVTDALRKVCEAEKVDLVYAIGPMPMMRAVCAQTKEAGISTVVSLDPIMVDGTGMCGGCRVNIGGQVKFTCVDGPEFDGHLVDWDTLRARKTMYREQEQQARAAQEDTDGRA